MRTVSFKSALHQVAYRMGMDPATNMDGVQAAVFTGYLNNGIRRGWEKVDFPEFMIVEERAYRDEYDNAKAYSIDDEIYYATEDKYYIAIQAGTGHLPTDIAYWEELSDFDAYVPWEQTGKTKLGEVFNVYDKNPYTGSNPRKLKVKLSTNGVQAPADSSTTLFVEFRKRPPVFTSVEWSNTTDYVTDDLVYYATTGECYKATQAGTGKNPASQTAYWEKVEFPYVLEPSTVLFAFAEALDEDGQTDKAKRQMDRSDERLQDEFDKLWMQEQQDQGYRVQTS